MSSMRLHTYGLSLFDEDIKGTERDSGKAKREVNVYIMVQEMPLR